MAENPFAQFAPQSDAPPPSNPFSQFGGGASSVKAPPADKPKYASGWEQLYSLTSPIEAIRQLQGGVESEMAGKFGSKFGKGETLPSALGATLAQLVRGADVGVGGMEKGGEALAGKGEYWPGETLPPETLGALINLAGVRGFGLTKPLEVGAEGRTVAQIARDLPQTARDAPGKVADVAKSLRSTPEQKAAKVEDKAARRVSNAMQSPASPAGRDVVEEISAARRAGQPLTLHDIESPAIKRLAGNVYRKSDEAAKAFIDFWKGRNAGAGARIDAKIDTSLSDKSLYQTEQASKQARTAASKEPWNEAMAGGSMAPLTYQFEQEMVAANQAVRDAQASMAQTGNVRDFEAATKAQDEVLRRLERARADGTANAPGATWSPRLQRFLNLPEVKEGLRHGYAQERRFAAARNEPFRPTDYAVVGETEDGAPIVGAVPNMRLLATAKEGLDGIINQKMKDGAVTKDVLSYIELRNALRNELDILNPAYKAARQVWEGPTAAIRALNDGREIFSNRFTLDELRARLHDMSPSEHENFVIGAADKLREMRRKMGASRDKGALLNNDEVRQRLAPLFRSEEEAGEFLASLDRESTMKGSEREVRGGSQTQERNVVDEMLHTAWDHAKRGHLVRAITAAGAQGAEGLARHFNAARQAQVDAAVARILTDPNVALQLRERLPPSFTEAGRRSMPPVQVVPPPMQYRVAPPQP